MNLRKTFFILPNLFTLSSVFCGFISVSLSASGQGGTDLYQAALAIHTLAASGVEAWEVGRVEPVGSLGATRYLEAPIE